MKNEVLSRSIVAVDVDGKVYTINEYTLEDMYRYALFDGTHIDQTAGHLFQIAETGVDLRPVYEISPGRDEHVRDMVGPTWTVARTRF